MPVVPASARRRAKSVTSSAPSLGLWSALNRRPDDPSPVRERPGSRAARCNAGSGRRRDSYMACRRGSDRTTGTPSAWRTVRSLCRLRYRQRREAEAALCRHSANEPMRAPTGRAAVKLLPPIHRMEAALARIGGGAGALHRLVFTAMSLSMCSFVMRAASAFMASLNAPIMLVTFCFTAALNSSFSTWRSRCSWRGEPP